MSIVRRVTVPYRSVEDNYGTSISTGKNFFGKRKHNFRVGGQPTPIRESVISAIANFADKCLTTEVHSNRHGQVATALQVSFRERAMISMVANHIQTFVGAI
jgi:hypothetical protein